MINLLRENWEVIAALGGSVIAYFGGKKAKEISNKKDDADAVRSIQELYGKFAEQTNDKFEEMRKEMTELKSILKEYIDQCSKCENNKIK